MESKSSVSMPTKSRVALAGLVFAIAVVAAVGWFLSRHGGEEEGGVPRRELSRDQLELRDGVLYARGETEAFAGLMVEAFPDGAKRIAIEISGGKPHGVSRGWYENGQLEVEEHFERGVSHGPRKRWFSNGAVKSEAQVVDGKIEGIFTRWHENGRKAAVARMVDGLPDGVSEAWHESGRPKSRVVLKKGEVIEREFFEDQNKALTKNPSS